MPKTDSATRICIGPDVAELAKINAETKNNNDLYVILAYIVVSFAIQLNREKTTALPLSQLQSEPIETIAPQVDLLRACERTLSAGLSTKTRAKIPEMNPT
ncbi:MAG: hypothetical protein ACSHXB_19505 [Sulfitobacter sp.]